MHRVWHFIERYSLLLIVGAGIALIWANVDHAGYLAFVNFPIWDHAPIGHPHPATETLAAHRTLTLRYLVNDVLMAIFFAIAAKEVWEAVILRDGSLRGRRAATPLIATLGGMVGPVAVYLGLALLLGSQTYDALFRGWAVPTATDIAFSYLVGRMVFGAGHPAVRFLLLLAIADDAGGLIVLALFYPSAEVAPLWLLLSLGVALAVFVLANWLPRRLDRGDIRRRHSTWVRVHLHCLPYAAAAGVSWLGFTWAGLHPALGLLPIIPAIPHADRAFGIYAEAEHYLDDLLNRMAGALKHPVEVILFLFSLCNAGVPLHTIGPATWLVFCGLLIGKPIGIFTFGWLAAGPLRMGLPHGMRLADLAVVGLVAAIGFTVSLFVASTAFAPGAVQDAARLGAVLSFAAMPASLLAGRVAKVSKRRH